MKAQITATWNPNNGVETDISFSEGWEELPRIAKLDCLHDSMEALEDKYQEILKSRDTK